MIMYEVVDRIQKEFVRNASAWLSTRLLHPGWIGDWGGNLLWSGSGGWCCCYDLLSGSGGWCCCYDRCESEVERLAWWGCREEGEYLLDTVLTFWGNRNYTLVT